MTVTDTCVHEACLCSRPYSKQTLATGTEHLDPNGPFCSHRCAERAGRAPGDGGCVCGHPECSSLADVGIPPID